MSEYVKNKNERKKIDFGQRKMRKNVERAVQKKKFQRREKEVSK